MGNNSGDRAGRNREYGAQVFHAPLAEDRSTLQPGGPIGKYRALVEAET